MLSIANEAMDTDVKFELDGSLCDQSSSDDGFRLNPIATAEDRSLYNDQHDAVILNDSSISIEIPESEDYVGSAAENNHSRTSNNSSPISLGSKLNQSYWNSDVCTEQLGSGLQLVLENAES